MTDVNGQSHVSSRGKHRRVTTISSSVKLTDIAHRQELTLLAPVIRSNDRHKLQNPSREYNFKCNGDIESGPLAGLNVEWTASFDKPLEQLLYPSLQRFDHKIHDDKRKQYQDLHGHYDRHDNRSFSVARGNMSYPSEESRYALPAAEAVLTGIGQTYPFDDEKLFVFSPTWKASVTAVNSSTSPNAQTHQTQGPDVEKLGEECLRAQLKERYLDNLKRQEEREQILIRETQGSHFGMSSFKRKDALKEAPAASLLPEMLYASLIKKERSEDEIDLSQRLSKANSSEQEVRFFNTQKKSLAGQIPTQFDHMLDGLLYYRIKNEHHKIDDDDRKHLELQKMTTLSSGDAEARQYSSKFTQQIKSSSSRGSMSIKEMTLLKNDDQDLISSTQLKSLRDMEDLNLTRVRRARNSKNIGLYKNEEASLSPLKERSLTPKTPTSREIHKSPHKSKREAQDALLLLQLDAGMLPERFIKNTGDASELMIDLSNYGVGDKRGLCLGKCLIPLVNLQSLGLSANRLTHVSLPTIIGNLCATSLLHMDLSFNSLHLHGAKALETFFKSKTVLKYLDISSCNLHCSDMKAICGGLQMLQHELLDLNLSSNKLLHEGAEYICQYLACRFATVTNLNLSWNTIGEQGTVAFANIMCYARSLVKLNLVSNNLGDVGSQNLIASMDPNTSNMTELDLTQNAIGSCACFVIASKLKSLPKLKKLDLSLNPLGEAGARAIFRVILHGLSCFVTMRDCSYNEDSNVFNNNNPSLKSPYVLDMAVPYNAAVLFELMNKVKENAGHCAFTFISHRESAKAPENVINLVLGKNNELVLKSTGVQWIPPQTGIIKVGFTQSDFIPDESFIINDSALEVLNIIVINGRSGPDRINWIRMIPQDFFFTTKQVQQTIDLYRVKNILDTDGGLSTSDMMKSFWRFIVDTENMFDFLCANDGERDYRNRGGAGGNDHKTSNHNNHKKILYAISLQRYKFNWRNATGSWRINLSDKVDRSIMMQLIALNGMENEFTRTNGCRGDTSQHGNGFNFRNERYCSNSEDYKDIIIDANFVANLPTTGSLTFDYVSTTRPSNPLIVRVITDDEFEQLCKMLNLSENKGEITEARHAELVILDLKLASAKYYFTVDYLRRILNTFADDPILQARVIVALFSRIKDLHRLNEVMRRIPTKGQNELALRLGYLNIINPLLVTFHYELDLRLWDNRRMLVDILDLVYTKLEGNGWVDDENTNSDKRLQLFTDGTPNGYLNSVRQEIVRLNYCEFGKPVKAEYTQTVSWAARREILPHFLVGTQPYDESMFNSMRWYEEMKEADALTDGPIDQQYHRFKMSSKSTSARASQSNIKMINAMRANRNSNLANT